MGFLKNLPIFRRFFLLYTVLAFVPIIAIVLLSNFFLTSLSTRSQAVQTSVDAQSLASSEQSNLQRMDEELQTRFNSVFATLSGSIADPALSHAGGLIGSDIAAREADFRQNLDVYAQTYSFRSSGMDPIRSILINDSPATGPGIISDQQQALDAVVTTLWPNYDRLLRGEMSKLDNLDPTLHPGQAGLLSQTQLQADFSNVYKTLWQVGQAFTNLQNNWQRVVDDAAITAKTVTTVGSSETNPILLGSTTFAFVILVAVIVIGSLLNTSIVFPLRQLALLTRRIAKGDTTARAKVQGRDEIYMVAASMNNMLDNIVHLIQETQIQRDILQAQVEKLVSEVSGVGEGDLRIQAEVTADALGVLADSFNYMVEELSGLIVRVKMVAREVQSSTTMTYERMSQLVEADDMQIQQIADAAIEVERMADSSRQVADRARVLYNVAREARQTAQNGRQSVQQTVEGMGRINENVLETSTKVQTLGESSREINNIVEVISNIAHQTNRLALDAAIQAAMAGENGKGFGAVAADIRRLAERAKDQASMITRIVRDVGEDIAAAAVAMRDTERETSTGARLAQEAGLALESIFNVVERQAREIEIINQMATQQLQSSSAVVQTMQGVSESTQQSSASTRDAAQNMERLARLAEQLLASVEAFKLRESQSYFAPTSNVTITPEDDANNSLSISGAFRTITASAQPSGAAFAGAPMYNALAPATPGPVAPMASPFSPYSLAPAPYQQPYPQTNGQGRPRRPVQSEQ